MITAEDVDFGDSGTGAVERLNSQTLTTGNFTKANEVETSTGDNGQTLTVGLPNNVTLGNNNGNFLEKQQKPWIYNNC